MNVIGLPCLRTDDDFGRRLQAERASAQQNTEISTCFSDSATQSSTYLEERRPWSSLSDCRFGPAQRNKGTAIDVVNVSLDGKTVGHDYSHFSPYAVNDSCPARLKILHAPSSRPTTRVSHPQTPLTTLSSGTENRPFCDSSGARRHTTVSAVRRRRSKARCARWMVCASCRAQSG